MSNYPPGVTGNEWQIAGPDEREMSVECSSEGFTVRTTSMYAENQIKAAIEDINSGLRMLTAVSRLRQALGDIEVIDIETQCPFVGDVTVFRTDGPWTWECPLCRETHEIEED